MGAAAKLRADAKASWENKISELKIKLKAVTETERQAKQRMEDAKTEAEHVDASAHMQQTERRKLSIIAKLARAKAELGASLKKSTIKETVKAKDAMKKAIKEGKVLKKKAKAAR